MQGPHAADFGPPYLQATGDKTDMFNHLKNDLPASVVVFFVALPLCLGIALASGAPLFSGLIATTIFLFARSRAVSSSELAGVDATQSSEVVFALIGGILLLHTPLPGPVPVFGIVLIMAGLGFLSLILIGYTTMPY